MRLPSYDLVSNSAFGEENRSEKRRFPGESNLAHCLLNQGQRCLVTIMKNIQNKLKKTGLFLSLAFGLLILSGVTANAQYRDDDNYDRDQRRERRDDRRDRQDDRRDRRNDRRDDRDDNYYGNNNGNYNNNGYYGNNGNYNNGYGNNTFRVAQQYGYQDGLSKGQEERREGDRYNPQNTSPYKHGLNGYDGRYGNKDAYKQAYRQAFLQGFERGYNQGGNRGGYNNRNRRGY